MRNGMNKLLAILFVLSGTLAAQPPRGFFPWWEGPLSRELSLTEDQQRQIREVLRDQRSKMIDQRAAVEKAEAELEDIFSDASPNAGRANEAIDRLVAARAELTRSFAQLALRLRPVLTKEQWQKVQERSRDFRFRQSMGGPGMGGPGRGGPGGPPMFRERFRGRPGGPPPDGDAPPPQPPQPRRDDE
jgi:Spy/CpxP family protein refolding chaperone